MLTINEVFGYDIIFHAAALALLFIGALMVCGAVAYSFGWRSARAPFDRKRDPKTGRIIGV